MGFGVVAEPEIYQKGTKFECLRVWWKPERESEYGILESKGARWWGGDLGC